MCHFLKENISPLNNKHLIIFQFILTRLNQHRSAVDARVKLKLIRGHEMLQN